jgi:uncharacterized protein YceK
MLSKGFEFCDGKSMKMIKMKIANKKILMNLTVLTIHFSIFSCVSFFTINQNISDEDTNRPIVYSGIRCTLNTAAEMFSKSNGMGSPSSMGHLEKLIGLFFIFDLPFSFLVDTIITPITIPVGVYNYFKLSKFDRERKCL